MSRQVRAAGAVVYSYDPAGELVILLITDRHGARTLPKGRLKNGESDEEAAVREIAEETGVTCSIEQPLARVRYPIFKKGAWRLKQIMFFLARAPYVAPEPATDEGITIAEWAQPDSVVATLTHRQIRSVVRKALRALRETE